MVFTSRQMCTFIHVYKRALEYSNETTPCTTIHHINEFHLNFALLRPFNSNFILLLRSFNNAARTPPGGAFRTL